MRVDLIGTATLALAVAVFFVALLAPVLLFVHWLLILGGLILTSLIPSRRVAGMVGCGALVAALGIGLFLSGVSVGPVGRSGAIGDADAAGTTLAALSGFLALGAMVSVALPGVPRIVGALAVAGAAAGLGALLLGGPDAILGMAFVGSAICAVTAFAVAAPKLAGLPSGG